jgi:DNA-binding transcriptional ArsR family regulator
MSGSKSLEALLERVKGARGAEYVTNPCEQCGKLVTVLASQPPGPGAFALHSCDNPPCCNPAHLRWGTPQSNQDDRRERRRHLLPARRKMDYAEMARLHASGVRDAAIAKRLQVSHSTVTRALKRLADAALLQALLTKEQGNG